MGLILVVSEDLVEIETIKAALSVHGWWITVATDRETAIQVAADQAPKLVVVDVDVPDSIELLRSFGSHNGGPGVLTCVPEGFDGALELREAGGDETLTKPVDPVRLLEAVQRCLAAPRQGPVERPEPSTQLLTTEEIFGDVLREIEEGDTTIGATASEPEPTVDDSPFGSEPTSDPVTQPIVSLAGLFDEPSQDASGVSAAAEWQGEERRSADRPWSPAGEAASEPSIEHAAASIDTDDLLPETMPAPSPLESVELDSTDSDSYWIEEIEEIASSGDDGSKTSGLSVPRKALAIGALAATLLVAVGVVLITNRGSDSVDPAGPPVEFAVEAPLEEPEVVEASEGLVVPEPEPEPVEAESVAAVPPPAEPDQAEDFNLEAIVDEEMERREQELRRVFLEEEKRLLRELKNLAPEDAPAEDAGEGDAGDQAGVGR